MRGKMETMDLDKIREKLCLETQDRDFVDGHVMPVIQGLVEALGQLHMASQEMAESHHDLMRVVPDPGARALSAEYHIAEVLIRMEFRKPTEWNYLSAFSATPQEIHDILKSGLSEPVYRNYQQAIGKKIVAEVVKELIDDQDPDTHSGSSVFPCKECYVIDAAREIDPGKYPSEVVRP